MTDYFSESAKRERERERDKDVRIFYASPGRKYDHAWA